MEIPLDTMRDDFAALVNDWGPSCVVTRNTGSKNAQGRVVDNWTSLVTENLWIQGVTLSPVSRLAQGVVEGTTHVGFQAWAGTPLKETDRIAVPNDQFQYDVLGSVLFPNHRKNWLKQVKR